MAIVAVAVSVIELTRLVVSFGREGPASCLLVSSPPAVSGCAARDATCPAGTANRPVRAPGSVACTRNAARREGSKGCRLGKLSGPLPRSGEAVIRVVRTHGNLLSESDLSLAGRLQV